MVQIPRGLILFLERYLIIPLVGYLISQNIFPVEHKDDVIQALDGILTGVFMLSLVYYSHNQKSISDIEVNIIQKCKDLFFKKSGSPAVPPTDTPKTQ